MISPDLEEMNDAREAVAQMLVARLLSCGSSRLAISPVTLMSILLEGDWIFAKLVASKFLSVAPRILKFAIGSKEKIPVPAEAKSKSEATRTKSQ
jgi:hypothetical protein